MSLEFRRDLKPDLLDLNLRVVVFSRHGRLSRTAFAGVLFLVGLVSMLVWYATVVLWGVVAGVAGPSAYVVGAPFIIALATVNAWPLGCVVAKRVHDADRSGGHVFWIVPVLAAGAFCWSSGFGGWFAVAARMASAAVFAGLLLLPGSPDVNRHGSVDNWG